MDNNYGQITKAIVVETNDPSGSSSNAGRVKVRIPIFHGPMRQEDLPSSASKYWSDDESLPWVEVVYPVGTSNPNPSSMFKKGEIVYVMFSNTSYRRPVIFGTSGRVIGS